jgi:hypothetical protein
MRVRQQRHGRDGYQYQRRANIGISRHAGPVGPIAWQA